MTLEKYNEVKRNFKVVIADDYHISVPTYSTLPIHISKRKGGFVSGRDFLTIVEAIDYLIAEKAIPPHQFNYVHMLLFGFLSDVTMIAENESPSIQE